MALGAVLLGALIPAQHYSRHTVLMAAETPGESEDGAPPAQMPVVDWAAADAPQLVFGPEHTQTETTDTA